MLREWRKLHMRSGRDSRPCALWSVPYFRGQRKLGLAGRVSASPAPCFSGGKSSGGGGGLMGMGFGFFEVLGDLCGLPSVACILQDVIPDIADIAWRTPSASDHAAAQGFVPCSNSVARRTSLLAVAYRFRAVRKNRYLHFGAGLIVGCGVLGLSGFWVDSKSLLALGLVGSCAGAGAGGQVGLGLPSPCGLRRRYA